MVRAERLKELMKSGYVEYLKSDSTGFAEFLADYLVKNEVVVPLCEIGGTAYYLYQDEEDVWNISEETVVDFSTKGFYISEFLDGSGCGILGLYEEVGETVFFDRAEAEKALKEREKE